jgi:hypothetical protein
MRVGGIQSQDLIQLSGKDRVLYGEVLEVADGIVRFRSAPPLAGTAQQPGKSSGTGAKARRRTRNKTTSQAQQPSPSPQPLPSPKPETSPTTPGTRPVTADFPVKQKRGSWLAHPHEQRRSAEDSAGHVQPSCAEARPNELPVVRRPPPVVSSAQPGAPRAVTAMSSTRLLQPWQASRQMPYRSDSAASDVDLARFDLRIIRAMQSSGHPGFDG